MVELIVTIQLRKGTKIIATESSICPVADVDEAQAVAATEAYLLIEQIFEAGHGNDES
jgi:enhancing lycopene biosynthesis protein 2